MMPRKATISASRHASTAVGLPVQLASGLLARMRTFRVGVASLLETQVPGEVALVGDPEAGV